MLEGHDGARKIKTRDEVECLRMTASIAEAIFSKIIKEAIKPRTTEIELRAIITYTAYMAGVNRASAPGINFGPHTSQGMAIQCSDEAMKVARLNCRSPVQHIIIQRLQDLLLLRIFSCGRPTQVQKTRTKGL